MKFLLVVLASVCAAVVAPHAGATTQDDNFLDLLASAGIPAHDGIPGVIAAGHQVCDDLDRGEPAAEIATNLANAAYSDAPVNSLDRYQRSMTRFVQVSAQAYCPGHAGNTAWHSTFRVVPIDDLTVPRPPAVPEGPDVAHMAPPVVAAKPKQNPPPERTLPPPPANPPSTKGLHGGQDEGGTGDGAGGGTNGGGDDAQPAPESPGGHIVLLP